MVDRASHLTAIHDANGTTLLLTASTSADNRSTISTGGLALHARRDVLTGATDSRAAQVVDRRTIAATLADTAVLNAAQQVVHVTVTAVAGLQNNILLLTNVDVGSMAVGGAPSATPRRIRAWQPPLDRGLARTVYLPAGASGATAFAPTPKRRRGHIDTVRLG